MSDTEPSFTARDQHAAQLNNVAGSQYNAYLQTVVQQRNSFLRDVAATRTRARRLIWFGFFLMIGGAVAFVIPLMRFMSRVDQEVNTQSVTPPHDLSPFSINGVPVGLFGWAAAGIGTIMLVVGVVLHVVATSRRRRVEQELPIAPPWPAYPPTQPPTSYHGR
jgi:hypothetical protein